MRGPRHRPPGWADPAPRAGQGSRACGHFRAWLAPVAESDDNEGQAPKVAGTDESTGSDAMSNDAAQMTDDEVLDEATGADEVDELLVEEVSIDGMCGVY